MKQGCSILDSFSKDALSWTVLARVLYLRSNVNKEESIDAMLVMLKEMDTVNLFSLMLCVRIKYLLYIKVQMGQKL